MQRWQPGEFLLSDFDIKIGRLSASVRKASLTSSDIERACRETDDAIARMMGKDYERPADRRGTD